MEWHDWSKRLVEVLELEHVPVAITYTDNPPSNAVSKRCRACGAIMRAARGEIFDVTPETSGCPGGSMYLGLGQQPPEAAKALREFLIRGEKLFSCEASIARSMANAVKAPLGAAEHVIFSPLDQAELPPDITVFVCTAWQAARLVNLATFESGMPMQCDPSGSLCRSAITYPLMTNRVNVTFGDVTALKSEKISHELLFVTFPLQELRAVVRSIDTCSAGTAPVEIPPAMRRMLEQSGGESIEV